MITNIILKNGIFKELKAGIQNSSYTIDYNTTEEVWDQYTLFLAKFKGNLEAGNFDTEYDAFMISRSKMDGTQRVDLAKIPFVQSPDPISYEDYTPPVGDYIYMITPSKTNSQLRGTASEIANVPIDFNGVWMLDKEDGFLFAFNQQWGSKTEWQVNLNQKRIEIPTFNKFPSVYYLPGHHATFSLTTLLTPADYSFPEWKALIDKIEQRVPLMIKSGSGDVYVCDVHSPSKSSWLIEAHRRNDPITITLQCVEIMEYLDYIKNEVY